MVVCLVRGADLHMAQRVPLPLTVSCSSKIQIGLPFWYRLTQVVPDRGPLNGCVCNKCIAVRKVATLNGLYILRAYVVQRHILVTGPLLAYSLCTIFTFSFSTYFSCSIIVRRCVLTASNKRILYCIVHCYGNSHATWDHTVLPATRQR